MVFNEMDALIVKNLSHINLAAIRLTQAIEPPVFKAIHEKIENWRDEKGWTGEIGEDGRGYWLAPPAWTIRDEQGGEPTYLSFFSFCRENNVTTVDADQFDLVSLCGLGRGRFGVRFFWYSGIGIKKQVWRRIASVSPAMSQLISMGFNYEEQQGEFFTPIAFDITKLTEAVEKNDMNSFISPLDTVLSILPQAVSVLQVILDAAQNQRTSIG